MDLKDYLSEHKLSQSKFADKAGLSQNFISELLAGNRYCGARTAQKISEATGGKVDALSLMRLPQMFKTEGAST